MPRSHKKTTGAPKPVSGSPVQNLINSGKVAFKRGDYAQAIRHWEQAFAAIRSNEALLARLNKALAEANFRWGQQLLFQDPAAALSKLIEAAKLEPADPLYSYHVALAHHRQGALDRAVPLYRQTLERDPGFKRAAFTLALALTQQGAAVKRDPVWTALDESQRALLDQQPTAGALAEAFAALIAGAFDKAEPFLSRALESPQPPKAAGLAQYYLGVIAQRRGDAAQALSRWTAAFDTGLNTSALNGNLSLALMLAAENALSATHMPEALTAVEHGLRIAPDNKRLIDMRGYLRLQSGYEAATRGDWKSALKDWTSIDNLSGANARYLAANQAIAYEKLERFDEAADAWREFVRRRPRGDGSEGGVSPEQVARLWSRIAGLYMKAGKPDEAVTGLQTALKYQPNDPVIGLALAHCYIDTDRIDAAHNQIDRVLKANPQNIDALVLRAELSEVAQRRGVWSLPTLDGLTEWEAVLDTGDENYTPIARERLRELYDEAISELYEFRDKSPLFKLCERAIKHLPDSSYLRARYAFCLMTLTKRLDDARAQIAQLDLTDESTLLPIVGGWQILGKPDEARAFLDKANALKPINPAVFVSFGENALQDRMMDVARGYFEEAIKRSAEGSERLDTQIAISSAYIENDQLEEGAALLRTVLQTDPKSVRALVTMTLYHLYKKDVKSAKQTIRDAERYARASRDPAAIEAVRALREIVDSPFAGMLRNMFGPGAPGASAFDFGPEMDFDDFDDFGPSDFFGGIDPASAIDNQPHYAPETDRRRRRKASGTP